jgi:quinoprotein glucose dehydrogenase
VSKRLATAFQVIASVALAAPAFAQTGAPDGQWRTWGGDAGHTRYAALDQITGDNVTELEIVWRSAIPIPPGRPIANYKGTPLMVDGVLYVPSGNHGASAIDAGTGETMWSFEPPAVEGARSAGLASRALAFWADGEAKRLYHNSEDGRLISIDATTGEMDSNFGEGGIVDLSLPATSGGEPLAARSVSPAVVVGDVVVAQVVPIAAREGEASGAVRGYDVRTGALLWTFNPIPRQGEFGVETWENGSWRTASAAGVWTMMTADPETGYVYLPLETANDGGAASTEFYAGARPGDNLFSESIVCLDSATGERVWHFQISHHGIWDYDMPAAPILHDITVDGEIVPAVTQLTKQGMAFVFNRLTGEPVWPIEEREVPQSTLEGEHTAPTQPFVTRPAPYTPLGYDKDLLIDFTPELRAEALEIAAQYATGPLYEPPTEAIEGENLGTWMYPGHGGGMNWNAAAYDPETHVMYVPIRHRVNNAGLRRGDPEVTDLDWVRTPGAYVQGPRGLPILKPPYTELVATDMDAGEHLWRIPTGGAPDYVREHPDLQDLGLDFDSMGNYDIRPSPLLTPELMFLAEAGSLSAPLGEPMFRAYDKESGDVVWEYELPSLGSGAPMTYLHEGRQFIVLAVSDNGHPPELVALALPE